MGYQLIVFDWDGTLYNSSQFIVKCVQQAAEQADLPVPCAVTIKQFIGLSVDEALSRNFPNLSPMKKANLIKAYRELTVTQESKPILFEGVVETLTQLKQMGYLLAIATSKHSKGLKDDLQALDLEDLFIALQSADQAASKPHPEMLHNILEQVGVLPQQALMVGDTEFDMLMAANAEVDAVAVSYGAHDVERLKLTNIKTIIHDIRELPVWLENEQQQNGAVD